MVASLIAISLTIIFSPVNESADVVDYSDNDNWLSLPSTDDKEVDVFYVYPTAWHRVDDGEPFICSIDHPMMREGANRAFLVQATAFETVGNIYAPYYRQADGLYTLSLEQEGQDELIGGTPTSDVIAAFEFFIDHLNDGRPYILVGHSQGSHALLFLLSEYMAEHPDVYARMVAAYAIGFPVTTDYLEDNPHLRFAENANDTGVIVSYNTEAAGYTGINPLMRMGAVAINPITWTRNETLATAAENLGSLVFDSSGTIVSDHGMDYADACVNVSRGVVYCSTVDSSSLPSTGFPSVVYHSFDFMFYYYDLRENASERIANYRSSR